MKALVKAINRTNSLKKGKSKPKPTTIVVRAAPKSKKKPKLKGRVKSKKQAKKSASPSSAYQVCLQNPFSPGAIGAKIPSPFTVPTTTYRLVTEFSTYSAVSKGALLFMPNPLVSVVDLSGVTTTNSAGACLDYSTSSLHRFNATNTYKNYNLYGAATPTGLTGIATSYRVAGWGVRIMNSASTTYCQGRLMVAKLPCIGDLPSYSLLNSVGADTNGFVSNITGAGAGFLNSPAIRELPDSLMSSALECMQRDVVVASRPTSAQALVWRPCQPVVNYSTNYFMGDDAAAYQNPTAYVAATSGGAVTTGLTVNGSVGAGWSDQVMVGGHEAIVFYFDGASAQAVSYNIELIYHLEVIPQLQLNSINSDGTVPIPEPAPVETHAPGAFESIVSYARRASNGIYYTLAEASQNWAEMADDHNRYTGRMPSRGYMITDY